ncbi:MAG: CoA ester lyase [Rhizobiaceae bacterium]
MSKLSDAATFLFVPGGKPERFEMAATAGADAVIIDLEDAVAPAEKDAARDAVAEFLARRSKVVVRINAAETPWFADDLAMLKDFSPEGIMLPKADGAARLREVADILAGVAQIPLIETAAGIAALAEIAAVESVTRLAFGTIDFQLNVGIEGDGEELNAFRSEMVLRSRLAGLAAPVDGVTADVQDDARLGMESDRARRFGFGAKLCIHPRQVPIVAAALAPKAHEIAAAERIVAAAEASASGVVTVDGRMVDRPVIELARRSLSRASYRQDHQGQEV